MCKFSFNETQRICNHLATTIALTVRNCTIAFFQQLSALYLKLQNHLSTMKKIILPLLTALFYLLILPGVYGQEIKDSSTVIIETTDDNQFIGVILSQDKDNIKLKSETLGEINIPKKIVKSIKAVKKSEIRGTEFWVDNPYATTRYFYSPSGYGLPSGHGYYQNTWIIMNQVSVGITQNISIGAGIIPIFLFALGEGGSETPIWFTPKISFPVKDNKLNIGLGALYMTIVSEATSGIGILYGVSTFGPKDKNLTLGMGWGYAAEGGFASHPTISISYIRRSKPQWAFLTENYLISTGNEAVTILSAGARHIGRKVTIDFGGVTFLSLSGDQDVFPLIPWLSINIPFQLKN